MSIDLKPCFFAILTAGWLAAGPVQGQTLAAAQTPSANPASSRAPRPVASPASSRAAKPSSTPAASRAPASDNGAGAARASASESGSGGAGAYLLAPQDVVEIRVFQEDDLLTTARIGQDGTIKFPLIGSVKISGKTEDSAAQVIGAGLAREFLVNPQVTVKIVEYAQRRYTVLGQVGKPGTYNMPDRASITLFEAIGNAGGFTRIAKLSDITVKRVINGKDKSYKLNGDGTASDRQATTFEIKPNDIITVAETFF